MGELYQLTWGSSASNVSATEASGGFHLSFTATSSGISYGGDRAMFVSMGEVQLMLNNLGNGSEGSTEGPIASSIVGAS